jgi:hypothetical protein
MKELDDYEINLLVDTVSERIDMLKEQDCRYNVADRRRLNALVPLLRALVVARKVTVE